MSRTPSASTTTPLFDPPAQHGDLVGREVLAALFRGHVQLGVVALDAEDEFAFIGLAGAIARPPLLSFAKAPSFVSSRRPALRALSSGPWQAKQCIGEDRSDVAGEIDRARLASPARTGESPSARTEALRSRRSRTRNRFADRTPCLPPSRRPGSSDLCGTSESIRPPLSDRGPMSRVLSVISV